MNINSKIFLPLCLAILTVTAPGLADTPGSRAHISGTTSPIHASGATTAQKRNVPSNATDKHLKNSATEIRPPVEPLAPVVHPPHPPSSPKMPEKK